MTQQEIDTLERIAQMGYVIRRLCEYCKDEGIHFEDLEEIAIIRVTGAAAIAFNKSRLDMDTINKAMMEAINSADS